MSCINADDIMHNKENIAYDDFFRKEVDEDTEVSVPSNILKTGETPFVKNFFLTHDQIKYVIPSYQRDFSWSPSDILSLLENIEARKHCYIGHCVMDPSKKVPNTVKIVDGQQRITAISLIAYSLINNENTPKKQKEELRRILHTDENELRLDPKSAEFTRYSMIVEGKADECEKSLIKSCYKEIEKYFFDADAKRIKQFIARLMSVTMDCKIVAPDEDPRLLFADINTKGIDLTDFDMVRQLLLDDDDSVPGKKLYTAKFKEIELILNNEVEHKKEFLRTFILAKTNEKMPRSGKWAHYLSFKDMYERMDENTSDMLAEMKKYADIYRELRITKTFSCDGIDTEIFFDVFGMHKVLTPLFMQMLYAKRDKDTPMLTTNNIKVVTTALRNFICRNRLCGIKSFGGSFETQITKLLRRIRETMNIDPSLTFKAAFSGCFKNILEVYPCPSDEMVKNAVINNEKFYSNKKLCRYILSGVEQQLGKTKNPAEDIYPLIHAKGYEIDHCLPNNIGPDGLDKIGVSEEEYLKWNNRIGNLTFISAKNNRDKGNKMTDYYGKDSFIHMDTITIDRESRQALADIEERTKIFADCIVEEWPSVEA